MQLLRYFEVLYTNMAVLSREWKHSIEGFLIWIAQIKDLTFQDQFVCLSRICIYALYFLDSFSTFHFFDVTLLTKHS